jgi:glycosyltransferase involved in cell wall biosynthesis
MSEALLPVVLFAFNRPKKLRRVLEALQAQKIDRLVIFVDGPRGSADRQAVEACRSLARSVDWCKTELHFWEQNWGLPGLADNIGLALEKYPWAAFVEDDCLPMPGFYSFMHQALQRYQDEKRVFSIGGYQYIQPAYFRDCRNTAVSCARFTCWGWATWRDRWQEIAPYLDQYPQLFDHLQHVSEIAGSDMPAMAHSMAAGQIPESWDIKVALACLWLKKVHLLATHGLVKNIGLDRSGIHGGLRSALRDRRMQNRNVVERLPENLVWPERVDLDCDYADELRTFVAHARLLSLRRVWQRGRVLARRYLLPGRERLFDLNLIEGPAPTELILSARNSSTRAPSAPTGKRALLSYIVHPFSISPQEARFLRHINIWHARELVRILNRMGYCVDVIDYRDTNFVLQRPYDLFIGHGGANFEHVARQLPPTTKKIYFSTGAYWCFHNRQEEARIEALRKRRNVNLPPDRLIHHSEEEALRLADGVIGIGNEFTLGTYVRDGRPLYSTTSNERPLPIMINGTSLYDDRFEWCFKDYDAGRGHFLFFSGGGNVHKGLDLLLEAFDDLEQHLWIASNVEPTFREVYARELRLPNVHLIGWLQPRSPLFYRLMRTCNFCILPSCSEGQSQSVVECMNQGLIPVVSREAGIDTGDYGILITPGSSVAGISDTGKIGDSVNATDLTPLDIRCLVHDLSTLEVERCWEMSLQARSAAQRDFSEERFAQSFQHALLHFLDEEVEAQA